MTTAVDTNVFIALFAGDPVASSAARLALETAAGRGPIIISPAVYAELVAGRDAGTIDTFLTDTRVEVDWDQPQEIWRLAGERYGDYARDRKRQRTDPGPRRILADFLIGAHAARMAWALLTSDTRIYGVYFPEIRALPLT